MKRAWCAGFLIFLLSSAAAATSSLQSLAELARKEAERRKQLDQQGVQAKRIDAPVPSAVASGGTVSGPSPASKTVAGSERAAKSEPRPSLKSFQTQLQKLDREIRQSEDQLKLLRARADAERWSPTKTAKGSRGSGSSTSLEQLRWQIQALETKLAGLRKDRSDTFQAGRKAGYLPGELEGRGIIR